MTAERTSPMRTTKRFASSASGLHFQGSGQDRTSRRAISVCSFHYPVKRIRETQRRVNEGSAGRVARQILLISQRRFAQPRERFDRREFILLFLGRGTVYLVEKT